MNDPICPIRNVPKYETLREFAQRFPDLDPLSVETCLHLLHLGSQLSAAMCAHFTRHELSAGRFTVLIQLLRHEGDGLSPAELSEGAGVTRATMTGLLDGLLEAGLITREQKEGDRRMQVIRLTAAGQTLMAGMLPDHYRRISALMQHLSEAEKQDLIALLDKVRAGLPALLDP